MGISTKRIILTIILAVLLVIAFGWVIMMQNHAALVRNNAGDETLKREEVTQTLDDIESAWETMESRIREQYRVDATLASLAVLNDVEKNGDHAITMYSGGAVIKVEDGKVTVPEDIEGKYNLTADLFEGRDGLFELPGKADAFAIYSRISGSYYYVEWREGTSIREEVESAVDIPGILRKTEAAYNVYALCAAEQGERILYCNDIIADLKEELQNGVMEDASSKEAEGDAFSGSGTLSLKDVTFQYIKSAVPEIDGYLILLSIQPNLYVKALGQSTYMFTALIVFLAALITSGIWLYIYIRNNVLPPTLEKWYRPANVRRFAALCGIIGAILIFLSGCLIYALSGLYDNTAKGKERLRTVEESLHMYSDRMKQNMERFVDIYLDYGAHIAEVLNNSPQLREQSVLETLADSISASSITLYDAEGHEMASSGEYIDLALGTDPKSVTYDFRRVLKGIRSVVHGVETDEITGQRGIRVGIRINDTADPERFGVMLICVDPAMLEIDLAQMANAVLENQAGENVILCIADQETGRIISSSSEDLDGKNLSQFGIDAGQLEGAVIKTVRTDDGSMYMIAQQLSSVDLTEDEETSDAQLACYIAPEAADTAAMLASAVTGSLLFVVIYAVLAWLILGRYTDEFCEQNKTTGPVEKSRRKYWSGVRNYLISIRPERIGLIAMEIIIGLYLTQQIPVAGFDTARSRNSLYYYITSGNWEKGINLFAIAGILILLGQIVMAVILIELLLAFISTFAGQKGKTICRLIRSLILYLALFLFIILALNDLGISMSAILAAIASLGIAVSLGAQHFVSDIIAGLTMVFEGIVHVGDIVDLGAGAKQYHGEVQEIGLRFIRIQTLDGNIISLSNRDINMTTNLTQMNSLCRCEIVLPSEYPIEEIEKMLRRELPAIGEKDARILKGPAYNGILSFGGGTMTVLITAECREEDLADVQLNLNSSAQSIFTQNGYRL